MVGEKPSKRVLIHILTQACVSCVYRYTHTHEPALTCLYVYVYTQMYVYICIYTHIHTELARDYKCYALSANVLEQAE